MNRPAPADLLVGGALVILAALIGDLVVTAAAVAMAVVLAFWTRFVPWLALIAPIAMALLTVLEVEPGRVGAARFPLLRPWSHRVGLVSAVAWLAAAWAVWRLDQPESADLVADGASGDGGSPAAPRPGAGSIGLLVALIVAAILAASILIG